MEHVPSLEELVRMTPPTLEEVIEIERIMYENDRLNEEAIKKNKPIKHVDIVQLTRMVKNRTRSQRAASQDPSTSAKADSPSSQQNLPSKTRSPSPAQPAQTPSLPQQVTSQKVTPIKGPRPAPIETRPYRQLPPILPVPRRSSSSSIQTRSPVSPVQTRSPVSPTQTRSVSLSPTSPTQRQSSSPIQMRSPSLPRPIIKKPACSIYMPKKKHTAGPKPNQENAESSSAAASSSDDDTSSKISRPLHAMKSAASNFKTVMKNATSSAKKTMIQTASAVKTAATPQKASHPPSPVHSSAAPVSPITTLPSTAPVAKLPPTASSSGIVNTSANTASKVTSLPLSSGATAVDLISVDIDTASPTTTTTTTTASPRSGATAVDPISIDIDTASPIATASPLSGRSRLSVSALPAFSILPAPTASPSVTSHKTVSSSASLALDKPSSHAGMPSRPLNVSSAAGLPTPSSRVVNGNTAASSNDATMMPDSLGVTSSSRTTQPLIAPASHCATGIHHAGNAGDANTAIHHATGINHAGNAGDVHAAHTNNHAPQRLSPYSEGTGKNKKRNRNKKKNRQAKKVNAREASKAHADRFQDDSAFAQDDFDSLLSSYNTTQKRKAEHEPVPPNKRQHLATADTNTTTTTHTNIIPKSDYTNTAKHPPNNKKRQLTEAVESNRPMKQQKQPFVPRIDCKYFIHGHCKDGDNCTFKHDPNAVQSKPTPAKPRIVCQFFKTNSCSKLGDCEFSHDLSIEPCRFHFLNGKCNSQTCSYSHAPLTDETRQMLRVLTGPCRFYYLKGFCNNGDLCNFSHSGCSEEERQRLEQEILPCKYFFSTGSCPKGDDCFYGHGELKNPVNI